MDNYDSGVSSAFTAKESGFFRGVPYTKDAVVNLVSSFGFFKVDTYLNQGNPADVHYVVFFVNKATQLVFEAHGTIGLVYIGMVRNGSASQDFPISDTRLYKANPADSISYFSQYSLRWEQATNNVVKKFYKPYDPAQATVASRLHEFDPSAKDRLVAYSEEYGIASTALTFSNWKDERGLGKYNSDIGIRGVGMPSQILLHETAGFGNLVIPDIQQVTTKAGHKFFPIPHFCINNRDDHGRGNIIQFVDIATNVSHGERTNQRSIGIEFVNPPIEEFKRGPDGRVLQPPQPIFGLETSDRGLYLKTKLAGLPRLFIPMEFSADAGDSYHEVVLKKDRLLNFAALDGGVGTAKTKILTADGDNIVIKFGKSDKFEHLATLVTTLTKNQLVDGLDDLTDETLWKAVFKSDGKRLCLLEHGWVKRDEGVHFVFDIREPAVFSHMLVGGHVDGGVQNLYLYLRMARQVSAGAALQLIVKVLTSEKTSAEAAKLRLKSKIMIKADGSIVVPQTPVEREFADIVELDESAIRALASP